MCKPLLRSLIAVVFFSFLLFVACSKTPKSEALASESEVDLPQIKASGVLRAITLESALSYFTDGDKELGYEYSLCSDYAAYLGVELRLIVAENLNEMQQLLQQGQGDIIVYRMPMSKRNKELFHFTSNVHTIYPVLIQSVDDSVTDATGLIGRRVYTRRHSRYWHLLQHLNSELGGGIQIVEVDSCNIDRLIQLVAQGEMELTVADSEVALLSRRYVPDFDSHVVLGVEQEYSWAVRKTSPQLLASVNEWYAPRRHYYERLKVRNQALTSYYGAPLTAGNGIVSPFDSIFKANAPVVGWDWRLMAALAYHESRFNPLIVSYAGAVGLMQLMPRTAERFGVDSTMILLPEHNVAAAAQYIRVLNGYFDDILDQQERAKFVLASYNSGPAHVFDARALAQKYGENPDVWYNSVEKYMLLKSKEEFYNDSVCKFGYFRANHTVRYVRDVMQTYRSYLAGDEDK